jgi:Ca-activated chloride channel homolog
MVTKIRSAVDSRFMELSEENTRIVSLLQTADCRLQTCTRRVVVTAMFLFAASNLWAESLASKNREGNRFFAKGKYEDAEKAYLDAQVKNPGRPEILYNLGNALIKQNKYGQGIQSLLQSEVKGDKRIRQNSWYNTGNALFSMSKFKESAEAYVQALKLDPADRDAKHNLELALMKLKQQQQKQPDSNQKQQNSQNSNKDPSSSGKENRQQQQTPKNQNESGSRKDQNNQAKQQKAPEIQREGSISKEQAAQILDAVRNQEIEQQRKLLESRAKQRANGKDW